MDMLDSVQSLLLRKNLDGLWARGQVISNNLTNADTPGYKAQTVSFEDELRMAMGVKNPNMRENALENSGQTYGVSDNLTMRQDGNNVDSVKEQAEYARTQYNFALTIRLMSEQSSRMRSVITEGRK